MIDTSSSPKSKGEQVTSRGLMDHLNPEVIYRLNQSFISHWKDYSIGDISDKRKKKVHFTLSVFSSHTRTFHWISVSKGLWDFPNNKDRDGETDTEKIIKPLIQDLNQWLDEKSSKFIDLDHTKNRKINTHKNRKDIWKNFLNHLPTGLMYEEAKQSISEVLKSKSKIEVDKSLTQAFLVLYSGFHNSAERNIEGMVIRWLKKCDLNLNKAQQEETLSLTGTFGFNPEYKRKRHSYFYPNHKWTKHGEYASSEKKGLEYRENIQINPKNESNITITGKQELIELFFDHLIAFPRNRKYANIFANSKRLLLVPIFDVWRGKRGFGSVKSVILLWFDNKKDFNEWKENKLSDLAIALPGIASEIASSGLTVAISQPIKPPYDLLRHFLNVLIYIQDWESATVFDDNEPCAHYQYSRSPGSVSEEDFRSFWNFQKEIGPNCCSKCSKPGNNRGEVHSCEECKKTYLWWNGNARGVDENLWDTSLIPGLGLSEKSRFGRYSIRFEFPEASYIPSGTEDRKFMRGVYLRQQLELMRLLIPQVQARRSALRSAVSAIMGRNMSHNIGSHVIARQMNRMKDDLKELNRDSVDHRQAFFGYLQRRMDFLAELATTEQSHWEQPLLIDRVVSVLDYKEQKKLIIVNKENNRNPSEVAPEPILLYLIAGKDGLTSTVTLQEGCGKIFSCPSGEVGTHALYIILENIIRNSARHNLGEKHNSSSSSTANNDEQVKLTVSIIDTNQYLKMTITDERTDISDSTKTDLVSTLNKIFSLSDSGFLDDYNSPETRYWGLREMQICAHYLRGIALTELESSPENVITACDNNGKLAYRIFLEKGKILAYGVLQEENSNTSNTKVPNGCKKITIDSKRPCWSDIARQAQGFSFLWLPEKLFSLNELKGVRHKLPVRLVTGECAELKGVLENIATNLDTSILHRKVLEMYRNNGCTKSKFWGKNRLIELFFFSDDDDANTCIGQLEEVVLKSGKLEKLHSADTEENRNYYRSDNKVTLGLIDHANDDNLWNLKKDSYGERLFTACLPHMCRKGIIPPDPQNWAAVEPVYSSSLHRTSWNSGTEKPWEIFELVTAMFARVVILDERVQSSRWNKVRAVTLWKHWVMAGIWVPFHPHDMPNDSNHDAQKDNSQKIPKKICEREMYHKPELACNLDKPKFKEIRNYLCEPTKLDRQLPADFLIIHLTILESLNQERQKNGNYSETVSKTLADLVEKTAAADANIIIVTGRGMPAVARKRNGNELPGRHLLFSTLLEYLTTSPSKLGLMRALWAAASPL